MALKITKIYGAPGTGKTTKLIALVEEALECGVDPTRIGYFSMTNKATNEVKERMAKKFMQYNVNTDFPYFRTLHSLSYALMGRDQVSVITDAQAQDWARLYNAGSVKTEEVWLKEGDPNSAVVRVKHPVLDAYSVARAKDMTFMEYAKEFLSGDAFISKWLNRRIGDMSPLTEEEIDRMVKIVQSYVAYKDRLGIIDFEDMLARAVDNTTKDTVLRFDVLFIDEAQDLSPMQWKVVRTLVDACEMDAYIAGDPDQSIYDSFGASSGMFRGFEGEINILPVSYRLHKNIYQYVKKQYQGHMSFSWNYHESHNTEEPVRFGQHICDLVEEGRINIESEWLILAPTKKTCDDVSKALIAYGVPHYLRNQPVGPVGDTSIRIQTIHSSKGGEADNVAVVVQSKGDEFMMKDRALCYVAETRARKFMAVRCYVGVPSHNAHNLNDNKWGTARVLGSRNGIKE